MRKSRTHSYDDLVDLLIALAMERENDSHKDTSICKGRPLLRRLVEGGRLNPTLTAQRAMVGI